MEVLGRHFQVVCIDMYFYIDIQNAHISEAEKTETGPDGQNQKDRMIIFSYQGDVIFKGLTFDLMDQ